MKPEKQATPLPDGWLDNLQQESWQLELLISGFAIFLLIGGYGPVEELSGTMDHLILQSEQYRVILVAYYVLRTAYLVLLICLLIHVLLRGVWIAAIGLRYVSGDIDYEKLRYRPRFTNWLARSMGSFDGYIERLERYCSILFSVAFLIIFCFFSLVTYMLVTVLLRFVFSWGGGVDWQHQGLFGGSVVGLISLVLGFIYFVDFLSLGFFKRNRFTARVVLPPVSINGVGNLIEPLPPAVP